MTVSGLDNLRQAVGQKKYIEFGTLIEVPSFGLRISVGTTSDREDLDFKRFAYEESLRSDPRIRDAFVRLEQVGNTMNFVEEVIAENSSGRDRAITI